MEDIYFDKENYIKWFELAYKTNLFKQEDPYMYMCEDSDTVYFKHGITRQYLNLNKSVEVV